MNNKTLAIISYITIIGWIIALILDEKKDKLVRFHLRQYLIIFFASIVTSIFGFIPVLSLLLALGVLILWIMGLVSAIQGEKKEIPLLGAYAQKWFTFI